MIEETGRGGADERAGYLADQRLCPACRRADGRDQACHARGLRRGQGHARGDVAEQRGPPLLQPQQARRRAGGTAGHQGTRTRPRRTARHLRRQGRRARQLRGGEERRRPGGRTAEVAFAVADTMHHRGIATLLLEHLVSLARARQLEALTAETLRENTGMLRVFSDAGLPVVSKREDGVVAITIPLPPGDAGHQLEDYLDTVAARERSANVASLRPVFAPGSVAGMGGGRRTG